MHKNTIYLLSLLGIFSFSFVSCNKEEQSETEPGRGFLKLDFGLIVDVQTRSVNTDDYIIKILNMESSKQVYQSSVSELPDILALYPGNYSIRAFSREVMPDAAFEAPFYGGDVEANIVRDEYNEIKDLTCTLQNMKVTIEYSELLKTEFKNYSVTVSNGTGLLDYAQNEIRAGYFSVAPLTVVFTGYRVDYEKTTFAFTINQVEKAQYHKIMLDVKYEVATRNPLHSSKKPNLVQEVITTK